MSRTRVKLTIVLVPLLLAACSPDSQTVAKCEFESKKIRPSPQAAIADLMALCMRGEGYGFSMAADGCKPGLSGTASDSFINPACYQSKWFLKVGQSLPKWAYNVLKNY
jgi:hypothetical protein